MQQQRYLILGLGADLCDVARMERALAGGDWGLLTAVFTPAELARDRGTARPAARPAARLAACFAAKEAVLKALAGCGGRGSFWQDIEIVVEAGRPRAVLSGRLGALAAGHGVRRILVAHGRCRRYAVAAAIALGPVGDLSAPGG